MLLFKVFECKDDDRKELLYFSEVQINSGSFVLQTLRGWAGTAVRWTNSNQLNHTLTSNEGVFNEFLSPGELLCYTFSTADNCSYVFVIHAGMSGVINVEQKRNDSRIIPCGAVG